MLSILSQNGIPAYGHNDITIDITAALLYKATLDTVSYRSCTRYTLQLNIALALSMSARPSPFFSMWGRGVLLLFSSYRGPFSPCRGYFCGLTSSYENFSLDMRMHWFRAHTGCHTGYELIPDVTQTPNSHRIQTYSVRDESPAHRAVLE